jgi:hypothetical protein
MAGVAIEIFVYFLIYSLASRPSTAIGARIFVHRERKKKERGKEKGREL